MYAKLQNMEDILIQLILKVLSEISYRQGRRQTRIMQGLLINKGKSSLSRKVGMLLFEH